jgi:hypothetical protein
MLFICILNTYTYQLDYYGVLCTVKPLIFVVIWYYTQPLIMAQLGHSMLETLKVAGCFPNNSVSCWFLNLYWLDKKYTIDMQHYITCVMFMWYFPSVLEVHRNSQWKGIQQTHILKQFKEYLKFAQSVLNPWGNHVFAYQAGSNFIHCV